MLTRNLFPAALVLGLAAGPVQAQPITLLDLISPDRMASIGAQWMITALRGVARVTYADMAVQPLQGRMVLTGLEVVPYDLPPGADCKITLDRAVISTQPLDQIAYMAVDLDLLGLRAAQGCLAIADIPDLSAFGVTDLVLDRGEARLEYTFGTGAMSVDMLAMSSALAEVRARVDFDYFAVDFESEEPVADLAFAELELRDRGVMALNAQNIPPELADAATLEMILREALMPGMAAPVPEPPDMRIIPTPEPGNDLPGGGKGDKRGADKPSAPMPTAPQPVPTAPEPVPTAPTMAPAATGMEALIADSAGVVAGFLEAPGHITLTLSPDRPVRLSEDLFDDPERFVATFNPRLTANAAPEIATVSSADLALIDAWQAGDGAPLAEGDALRLAGAFLSGMGAPRDPARAMDLLDPLLESGNQEAMAMVLDRLDALEPGMAYRLARKAAAAGDRRAFASLDRLERALGLEQVIAIQGEASGLRALAPEDDARALHDKAFAALTGIGTARSYGDAYVFGLLALASGDPAAERIVDEVEGVGNRLGAEDADFWPGFLDGLRAEATASWFANR